jgi:DNA-binding response OmpR family regulator
MASNADPRRRLLHVDDDVLVTRIVRRILDGAGFDVVSVHDGAAGLEALATHAPVFILLDVDIGEENGYELCGRMRERGATAPIAFLTANRTLDHVRRAEAAGGNFLIAKPFSPETLLSGIAQATAARERIDARK